jgi:hypothetical protein
VGQVLNDDRGAGGEPVEDGFGEDVIAIASEPLFAAREASQVPFRGLAAVRLQSTSEAEGALDDFAPVALAVAVEPVVRGDSRTVYTEIDTDRRSSVGNLDRWEIHDDVEIERPLAEDQVGGGDGQPNRVGGILRQVEREDGQETFRSFLARARADRTASAAFSRA